MAVNNAPFVYQMDFYSYWQEQLKRTRERFGVGRKAPFSFAAHNRFSTSLSIREAGASGRKCKIKAAQM